MEPWNVTVLRIAAAVTGVDAFAVARHHIHIPVDPAGTVRLMGAPAVTLAAEPAATHQIRSAGVSDVDSGTVDENVGWNVM
jgi:hypothetical protein